VTDQNSNQEQNSTRKRHSAEEKFKIVKEHLTTKTPITEICRKYNITTASFYEWQEQFFIAALEGLETRKRGPKPKDHSQEQIQEMTQELDRMKSVIAEITAENIAFKKKNLGLMKL
jgi:transposase-like protein